jgi:hypothetical protein
MKNTLALAALLAVSSFTFAGDAKPLLHEHALPMLAAPDFKGPLDASFSIAKGRWTPEGGVLSVLDLPEEKHIRCCITRWV